MSSALAAAPLLAFVVVVLLGFAGCWLPTQGTGPEIELPTPSPYVDKVKNSNPVAYWRLSDPNGSQDAKDENGPPPLGDHPGTYLSPTPGDVVLGQSPSLNASDPSATPARFNGGHVEIDHAPAFDTSAFTVEVLVHPAIAPQADGTVVSDSDFSAERGWALSAVPPFPGDDPAVDGYWEGRIGDGAGSLGGLAEFSLKTVGSAVHLAMTYDGAWVNLYKDGELVASNPFGYAWNTQQPLRIGAGFQGAIQEVAVYGAALTSDEITIHWLANQKP
jgi:hypothetical protein